ncbi:MAG TPA: hypothetical protein VGM76_10760, partial [Lacipirellulaceae bacterium]
AKKQRDVQQPALDPSIAKLEDTNVAIEELDEDPLGGTIDADPLDDDPHGLSDDPTGGGA